MPRRKTTLATDEHYHIFNRSVRDLPIFKNKKDYQTFLEATKYYLQVDPLVKFSDYKAGKPPLNLKKKMATIVSFCIMPTHFHFILKQEQDEGIRQFVQKLSNSFAHFFNLKYRSRGPVFEGNFKAIHIETDEQLWHLSRYIHLNPVTAYLVESPKDYPYSSYLTYLEEEKNEIVDPSIIMGNFTPETYQKFVLVQKDYQRELEKIKHLLLE